MFCGDNSLTSLHGLENWDVSSVKDMGCMLQGCTNLTDISALENWDVKWCDRRLLLDGCPISHEDLQTLQSHWKGNS